MICFGGEQHADYRQGFVAAVTDIRAQSPPNIEIIELSPGARGASANRRISVAHHVVANPGADDNAVGVFSGELESLRSVTGDVDRDIRFAPGQFELVTLIVCAFAAQQRPQTGGKLAEHCKLHRL
jgi:hypothetical protein